MTTLHDVDLHKIPKVVMKHKWAFLFSLVVTIAVLLFFNPSILDKTIQEYEAEAIIRNGLLGEAVIDKNDSFMLINSEKQREGILLKLNPEEREQFHNYIKDITTENLYGAYLFKIKITGIGLSLVKKACILAAQNYIDRQNIIFDKKFAALKEELLDLYKVKLDLEKRTEYLDKEVARSERKSKGQKILAVSKELVDAQQALIATKGRITYLELAFKNSHPFLIEEVSVSHKKLFYSKKLQIIVTIFIGILGGFISALVFEKKKLS